MTGDASLFIEFKAKEKGYVTYSDNNKGTILGVENGKGDSIGVGVDTTDILKNNKVVGSDQPSTEVSKEKDDKPSPSNEDKDDGGSSSSKNHHKQRGAGLAKEWLYPFLRLPSVNDSRSSCRFFDSSIQFRPFTINDSLSSTLLFIQFASPNHPSKASVQLSYLLPFRDIDVSPPTSTQSGTNVL
ncbi:hypothetical protein QL285_064130 [Trifolium repens]|nr:hypothetical protein QL285_064130 [Trifolium repens]